MTTATAMTVVQPGTMEQLEAMAKHAAGTGWYSAKTPSEALLVMMSGRDLGLSYTQSLRSFYVVKGKVSLSADAMTAVCMMRRDVCEYFRPIEESNTSSTWETKRVGQPPVRGTFTMKDAQDAGIVSDMYRKYPKRMLGARAKAFLARDVYPDLIAGLYTEDELGLPANDNAKPVVMVQVPANDNAKRQSDAVPTLSAAFANAKTEAELLEQSKALTFAKKKKLITQEEYEILLEEYKLHGAALKHEAKAVPHDKETGEVLEGEVVERGDNPNDY